MSVWHWHQVTSIASYLSTLGFYHIGSRGICWSSDISSRLISVRVDPHLSIIWNVRERLGTVTFVIVDFLL